MIQKAHASVDEGGQLQDLGSTGSPMSCPMAGQQPHVKILAMPLRPHLQLATPRDGYSGLQPRQGSKKIALSAKARVRSLQLPKAFLWRLCECIDSAVMVAPDEALFGKKYQGVEKRSTGYKLLAAMGWKEGEGLVSLPLSLVGKI